MLSRNELENAREALAFLSAQGRDYAIYGIGEVGKELLKTVRAEKFRAPLLMLDDKPGVGLLDGVKVVQPDSPEAKGIRELILGSNRFQERMRERVAAAGLTCSTIDLCVCRRNPVAAPQPSRSETAKVRESLRRYCVGDGLDVGFGGDPILPTAITMDLPTPYAKYQSAPQHLHGDARSLRWFADGSMDYLYSSHLLEDFEDPKAVLFEWLRVIRPGGRLVLFCPDEQTYRDYCASQGKPPNKHHHHADFGIDYIKRAIAGREDIVVEHELFPSCIYSFELVLMKKGPGSGS